MKASCHIPQCGTRHDATVQKPRKRSQTTLNDNQLSRWRCTKQAGLGAVSDRVRHGAAQWQVTRCEAPRRTCHNDLGTTPERCDIVVREFAEESHPAGVVRSGCGTVAGHTRACAREIGADEDVCRPRNFVGANERKLGPRLRGGDIGRGGAALRTWIPAFAGMRKKTSRNEVGGAPCLDCARQSEVGGFGGRTRPARTARLRRPVRNGARNDGEPLYDDSSKPQGFRPTKLTQRAMSKPEGVSTYET
jgi:hypothetical protein